ncbi:MAG: hypothetical protein SVV03_01335 [Candidatus Nanohaloarchaea archaeon]|nr:hypothetical protein [Candidatus Nanohaloarchaea archaeon]
MVSKDEIADVDQALEPGHEADSAEEGVLNQFGEYAEDIGSSLKDKWEGYRSYVLAGAAGLILNLSVGCKTGSFSVELEYGNRDRYRSRHEARHPKHYFGDMEYLDQDPRFKRLKEELEDRE